MTDPSVIKTARPAATRARRAPVLDRIDVAILTALQENGRMTYQALSERVGLSPRPCLERVRRLEHKGVIRGFSVLLDGRRARPPHHDACRDCTPGSVRSDSPAARARPVRSPVCGRAAGRE